MAGGGSKSTRRGRGGWAALVGLAMIGGIAVSGLGALSYGPFTWQAYALAYNNGAACSSPTQCDSGFCVTGVCCDSLCNLPNESCILPAQPGTCTRTAGVPALSHTGELIAVLALLAGAWIGWRLRTR